MAGRGLPPLPKVLLENGRRPCRGCGGEIPKGRLRWCDNGCRERHYMGLSSYARTHVWARDRGVCALCRADCGGRHGQWEADHIRPLVLGGTNELANYRTLCVDCHKKETAKLARARSKRGRQTNLFDGAGATA